MARMCLHGYVRPVRIFYGVVPGLYRASRPGRSGVSPSTDFETMASHDAGVVYFTEYLSVLNQLAYSIYLAELYGECNGTARACVNSGYQALFSQITERLTCLFSDRKLQPESEVSAR